MQGFVPSCSGVEIFGLPVVWSLSGDHSAKDHVFWAIRGRADGFDFIAGFPKESAFRVAQFVNPRFERVHLSKIIACENPAIEFSNNDMGAFIPHPLLVVENEAGIGEIELHCASWVVLIHAGAGGRGQLSGSDVRLDLGRWETSMTPDILTICRCRQRHEESQNRERQLECHGTSVAQER